MDYFEVIQIVIMLALLTVLLLYLKWLQYDDSEKEEYIYFSNDSEYMQFTYDKKLAQRMSKQKRIF